MSSERRQTNVESDLSIEAFLDRESIRESYEKVIDDICELNWKGLSRDDIINTAWTYYYFSVQFRENVVIARRLYPNDLDLAELDRGERDTDNLSPCAGVVAIGERVDHDEFMRRALGLTPIDEIRERRLKGIGEAYLKKVRTVDDITRALSLASYEGGGLERVFRAILQGEHWDVPSLRAFRHFLEGHIELDSDPDHGHGSLCGRLAPNDRVCDLWLAFKESLIAGAPGLTRADAGQAVAG
ncbi:MAG: hypothetical protein WB816_05035 [Methylocystis sp.]